MRVPQVIDLNTQQAYRPSKVSLNLIDEQKRQIHPEDFTWDCNFIPTLAVICLKVLANNFESQPILYDLDPRDQDHIQELISNELGLDIVVPLIESEQYWKRRYQAHFSEVPYQTHLGWTWKCLYLEQHIRQTLENAEPQYNDEETFKPLLTLCFPYIHSLSISQLQQWKPPKTWLPKEHPQEYPTHHISFIPVLQYLPYLVLLEIRYGMNDVGEGYDCHMFKMAVEDCEKLGEAILNLKHLKVLRLHGSDVRCKHVQGLMKKLMRNKSLIELDLSHCKIGDLGAKCIGKMLTVHENLKVLKLTNNLIGEKGVRGIAWALLLPEGAHLQVLDLSLNPLKGQGMATLMCALARGILPRELSVSHCEVPQECSHYISCMLVVNSTLHKLDISGNVFGESGGQKLLECLQSNQRLTNIDMRDTQIPETIQDEIRRILTRNLHAHPLEIKNSMNMIFIEIINTIKEEQQPEEVVSKSDIVTNSYSSKSDNESSLRNFLLGPDGSYTSSSRSVGAPRERKVHIGSETA